MSRRSELERQTYVPGRKPGLHSALISASDNQRGPTMTFVPPEAVQAGVKTLWDKREMLPEYSEEIVREVLDAAVPLLPGQGEFLTHHEARAIRLALIFGVPAPAPPEIESAKAKIAKFEDQR